MKIHAKHQAGKVRLLVGDTTYRISSSAAARLAQQLSDASGEAIKHQSPEETLSDLADLLGKISGGGKS